MQLCNLTIHFHGSILGSFESQEPQLSFSSASINLRSVRSSQLGRVCWPLQPPDRCVRLPARNESDERKFIFSQFDQIVTENRCCLSLTLSLPKKSVHKSLLWKSRKGLIARIPRGYELKLEISSGVRVVDNESKKQFFFNIIKEKLLLNYKLFVLIKIKQIDKVKIFLNTQ